MTGNFDMGHVLVSVAGQPLDNVIEVNFNPTTKNGKAIMSGGGKALGHTKQSKGNHRTIRVRMAHPSGDEQRLNQLANDETDTSFAFTILDAGIAQLPDGARTKFTSDQVVIKLGDEDYKDEPGVREFTISCIGFREEFKNSATIIR